LIQTTNVPSDGFEISTTYTVTKSCNCCITEFDSIFRWRDLADMHPDRHWPDSWVWWTGTVFYIDISWTSKSTFQIPSGPGGCEVKGTGWPFPNTDPNLCGRCN
jgi:hypothetical protein